MPSLEFSTLFDKKAATVQAATEDKKAQLGNTSSAAGYLISRIEQEQALAPLDLSNKEAPKIDLDPVPENSLEAMGRGGREAIQGMVGLGYGLGAGVGAIAESIAGEGGLSSGFKEAMVKKYIENEQDMAQYSRPEDSLTYSWEKAKDGDYGAMLSWATHGTGYVASQLATILAGSGVVAGGTRLIGKKMVGQVMSGLVEKEATRLAAGKTVTEAVLNKATANVTAKVGEHLGMAASGFGMEGGEILGDLAKQSTERGTPLTAGEIGQGLTATALAGAVEYMETLLSVSALKGKLGKFPGATEMDGIAGKLARGAITGGKTAAGEAVQEATQTGIERWGKGDDLTSEDAVREYIDAAGLGALGGGPASVGGVFTRSTKEQEEVDRKRAEKKEAQARVRPQTQPGFDQKVAEVVETGNTSQFTEAEKPENNPTTAMHVAQKQTQKEGATRTDKLKTRDDAVKVFQSLVQSEMETKAKVDALDEKIKTAATPEDKARYTEEQAQLIAKGEYLKTQREDVTPLMQSIVKATDDEIPGLVEDFKKSFEQEAPSGAVNEILRKVFGSNGGKAFFQDDSVDFNQIIKDHQDKLTPEDIGVLQKVANLQKSVKAVVDKTTKSMGQVNTDILDGGDGYIGLFQHKQGVVDALNNGDIQLAAERQNAFSQWAKERVVRANTFTGMYQAFKNNVEPSAAIKKSFGTINAKQVANGRKAYSIGPKTWSLAETMRLEAKALNDGVALTQAMFPSQTAEQTQSNGTVANVASPSTQVDTTNPGTQTSPDLEGRAGDAQSNPGGEQTSRQGTPAPKVEKQPRAKIAPTVQLPSHISTDTQQTLSEMGFVEEQIQEMKPAAANWHVSQKDKSLDELREAQKAVNPNTAKAALYKELIATKEQQEQKEDIATPPETKEPKIKQEKPSEELKKESDQTEDFPFANEPPIDDNYDYQLSQMVEQNDEVFSPVVEQEEPITKSERDSSRIYGPANQVAQDTSIDPSTLKTVEDYKKTNAVKAFTKVKGEANLFNGEVEVIDHLKEQHAEMQGEQKVALGKLISFMEKFSSTLDKLYQHKNTEWLFKDALSYFTVFNGETRSITHPTTKKVTQKAVRKLPENFKAAMALSAFNWLSTQAETEDLERTIKKILGLKASTIITNESMGLMDGLGNKGIYFSEVLGRDVIRHLQLSFSDQALENLEENLSRSTGMAILTNLQQMGYLKRQYVDSGKRKGLKPENSTFGLQGLANKLDGIYDGEITSFLLDGPQKGVTADDFFSLKTDKKGNVLGSVKELRQQYKPLKVFLDDQFEMTPKSLEVSFVKPELTGGQERLQKSSESATKEQTANKEKNEQTPYNVSNKMDKLLRRFGVDAMKLFAGYQSEEGRHVNSIISIKGKNRSIDRSFEQIQTWYEMAQNQKSKFLSKFFIRSVFQAVGRMRQVGLIRPQGDKIHRNFFNMSTTEVEIDPHNNEKHRQLFIEAVGQGLGIEASKYSSLEETLRLVDEKLATPVIQEGLKALKEVLDGNKKATPEQVQAVMAAIKSGGEDLHTLKVLEGYQTFLDNQPKEGKKGKPFKTDLYLERDGLANGVMMMLTQLRTAPITRVFLARLMSVGLGYRAEGNDFDHATYLDPYMAIARHWNTFLNERIEILQLRPRELKEWNRKLREEISPTPVEAQDRIRKIRAINRLLEGLDKPGDSIVEHKRKLAKNLNVGAIYGAEKNSTERGIATKIVDDVIPETLESIAALRKTDRAAADLLQKQLQEALGNLTQTEVWDPKTFKGNPLEWQLSKEAKKDIYAAVSVDYGTMLYDAMSLVYGDFREASKLLNPAIGLAAANYNAALQALIQQHVKEGKPLTRADVKAFKARLESILPRIKTPMGGFINLTDFTGSDVLEEDDFSTIEQTYYQVEGFPKIGRLMGKAVSVKELKAPGVKPIPSVIHMLDSMVANMLMGAVDPETFGILNIHDAGITNILQAAEMTNIQNKAMFENMRDYNLAFEIEQAVKHSNDAFVKLLKEGSLGEGIADGIAKNRDKIFADEKYNKIPEYPGAKKKIEVDTKTAIEYVSDMVTWVKNKTSANKKFLLGLKTNPDLGIVTHMNQYMDPTTGGYKTGITPKETVSNIKMSDILKDAVVKTSQQVFDVAPDEVTEEEILSAVTEETPEMTTINPEFDPDKKGFQIIRIRQDGEFIEHRVRALTLDEFPGIELAAERTSKNVWTFYEATTGLTAFKHKGNQEKGIEAFKKAVTLEMFQKALKDVAEKQKTLGSSRLSNLSLDPADYALESEINRETILDTYEAIKNNGSKSDNVNHDFQLKHILSSLVQNVIEPLDLFMKSSTTDQTEGAFDYESGRKDRVFISNHSGLLNLGIQMSTGEVYTHELVHAVIHKGLEMNRHLYDKVNRLYDVAYNKLKQTYGDEGLRIFLSDPNNITNQAEISLAHERFNYLFRDAGTHGSNTQNQYTGVTSNKIKSNHLDEFMAFGLTNENFSNFLKGISLGQTDYAKSTWSNIRGANIQETLLNIFQMIMDFFRGRLTDINRRVAYQELEALAQQLSNTESRWKSQRFEVVRKFVGLSGKLSEKGNSLVKATFKKVAPKAETWKEGYDILMKDPSKGGQMLRDLIYKARAMDQGVVKTTVQEARGVTERLSDYYQMLTRKKRILDASKEAVARAWSSMANDFFTLDLTKEQKTNLTKAGLKADAGILLDVHGSDHLLKIYSDESVRNMEIQKVLDTIEGKLNQILESVNKKKQSTVVAQYLNYYDRAAMALGDFIIHSQFRKGEDAPLNAQLIAELAGTTEMGNMREVDAKKVEPLIDQLASLYAIGSLSENSRAEFADILTNDAEGVSKMFQMQKTLKEQARETLFAGSERLFIKGYVKTVLNPEMSLEFGTLADEAEMTRLGYTRSEKPLPRDEADVYRNQDIYLYTARNGRMNTLQSGLMSYTRNKAKGQGGRALAAQTSNSTEQGYLNMEQIIINKHAVRDHMFTQKRNSRAKLSNVMVAKTDALGFSIDYRYMMSEASKDAYLSQVSDFDTVFGSMAAQILDKGVTPIVNEELIHRLKQTYDEEYQNNPAAFKAIGPNVADPDMVEQYYLIPEKTRKVVADVWGPEKTMYVPKDLMTLAFGYRKYSIIDAFTKKPSERARLEKMVVTLFQHITRDITGESGRAIKAANTAERMAIEMTHYAKDNIIVKSLTVTLGNFGSNLMYLRMRGVPISTTLKHGWDAVKYGTRFQADSQRMNKLLIEKDTREKSNTPEDQRRLKEIQKELMQLKDALARNPVLDSIDSGLMPSLVDDVDTQGQQNYFPGMIESYVEDKTKNLPKPVKQFGRVAFLTQDTEVYKVLNNAVKMTDFVGRHILYKHYTESLGMSQKEAAAKAIDEFVNFDIASHRITEYLNEIGLLWFTKYATRIPRIAIKAVMDRPFDSAMSYLLSTHLGTDNILDSTIPNLPYKTGLPPTAVATSMDDILSAQGAGWILGSILP